MKVMEQVLTAYNEQIIKWTKKPNEEKAKPAKEIRLALFKKLFINTKKIFEKAFTAARIRILDEIIYKSVETGVYHANCATIAENCGLSVKTVERAVEHIKESKQFVIGYGANGRRGGYIFVDRLHRNFKKIMFSLFSNNAANFFKSELESEHQSELESELQNNAKPTVRKAQVLKIEKPTISSRSSISLKQANNNNIYNICARACMYKGKVIKTQDQKQNEYIAKYATNGNQKVLFNRIKACENGLLPCIQEQAHIISLRIGDKATPATVVQAMDILIDLTDRQLTHNLTLDCELDATTIVKVFYGQLTAKQLYKPVQAKKEPKKRISAPVRLYNWVEEKAEQVVTTITQHPLVDKFFNSYDDLDDMPF